MSCGNPAAENDALMTRRPKFDHSKECIKCKARNGNIVIRHAVYCRGCFFPLVNTKFRKTLQPSINEKPDGPRQKALKASGNLLIGLSGGLASTVLTDLVAKNYFMKSEFDNSKGGKDHPRKLNEKVWAKGYICYVEVCHAFPGLRNRTDDIRAIIEEYGVFEFIPLNLEDAFDSNWWKSVGGSPIESDLGLDRSADGVTEDLFVSNIPPSAYSDPISRLRAYLSAMPTQTALLTSVQTLIKLLLLYTARSTGSSHLLLGTSLTSLSIALISGIAQGGGFTVREEVQEEWESESDRVEVSKAKKVRLIRPLRDVITKECAIWAWWNGLTVVGQEPIPEAKQGIGSLTKDFIIGLETDYPSTVSTIARTCAKLAPKEKAAGVCALCQRPAQLGVQHWKSKISILSYTDSDISPSQMRLGPSLCYACHTTLTGRSSRGITTTAKKSNGDVSQAATFPTPLPVWVQARPMNSNIPHEEHDDTPVDGEADILEVKPLTLQEMKDRIGAFLMDDET